MSNQIDYCEDSLTGNTFIDVDGNNKSGTENNLRIVKTTNDNKIIYEISQKLGRMDRLSALELTEEEFERLRLLMRKLEDDE